MLNRRILIVDDNVDIHTDFKKILLPKKDSHESQLEAIEEQLFGASSAGKAPALEWSYEIDSAYQGQQALEMVETAAKNQKPYAMIFMDVRMPPGWDGIETIQKIWEKHPYTEVVLCSAYSDYTSDEIISTLGESHRLLFMKKPFDGVAVKHMALAMTTKWNFESQSRRHVEELELAVQKRTQELETSVEKLTTTNRDLDASLKQLQETQSLLLQASKMSALGEMAGGIAHEVNTPLGTISLLVSQLQTLVRHGSLDQDELSELLKMIETTVTRIAKIIRGLRSFSRDGSHEPFKSTSIRKIVDDTLALCSEKMKNHGIEIKLSDIPADLAVECREVQISQVLLNLFNNAYDAIEKLPQKWIQIETKDQQDHVQIVVTDSGPGIPPEIQQKLFQPFFTTKEVGKGTGLGLSISRGILQAHKGKFFLGDNHQNTEFVIQLPKRQNS